MFERYPHIAQVPADAPQGLDTPLPPPPPLPWSAVSVGHLVPIDPASSDGAKDNEAPHDGDTHRDEIMTTWHEVALSIAAELMDKARETVHTKLGYSTSAVSNYIYSSSRR